MKAIWKDALGALFLACCLGVATLAGCQLNPLRISPAKAPSIESALSLASPIMLYHGAGVAVILAGVAVLVFGGKISGATLIACGAGIALFGHALILHPWLSLLAVVSAGVVTAFVAYDRHRKTKALDASIVAIQPHGEVKQTMCDGDTGKQQEIRPVINERKRRLRAEGKI